MTVTTSPPVPGTIRPTSHALQVRFDAFELDELNARLLRDGRDVPIAPTPFALLCALVRQPRALLTKDALLEAVWGHQFLTESVLKTAISDLRAVLQDEPEATAIHRDGGAARVSLHRNRDRSQHAHRRNRGRPQARRPRAGLPRYRSAARMRSKAWARHGSSQAQASARSCGSPAKRAWGRPSLIERFMAEAGDIQCAHGQCVEQYGEGEPYLPVLEALTALCRRDAGLVELIRAVAPTWLLQLPWLSSAAEREALRRELTGTGQVRMLREMGELLDRCTADRPLLLVTEDLHWSDQSTVQLIDYVARRRTGSRLLWLASFRLSEIIGADHPLADRAARASSSPALRRDRARRLLREGSRRVPGRASSGAGAETRHFVRALHDRTDGLPLFVADVVSDLAQAEQGRLERIDCPNAPGLDARFRKR